MAATEADLYIQQVRKAATYPSMQAFQGDDDGGRNGDQTRILDRFSCAGLLVPWFDRWIILLVWAT